MTYRYHVPAILTFDLHELCYYNICDIYMLIYHYITGAAASANVCQESD